MATQGPLTKLYSTFLVDPKKEALHSQAGLHYISSTGSSVQTAQAIISHLAREALLYKKKEQKVLSAVESKDSVVVEVSTTIEFTNGGGTLLPGLDDNFVSDQTIHLPIVHIVQLEEGLIKQIRLYWDQASILKQLGVIGKTGKNWPILLGEEQLKLVKSSVGSVAVNGYATESAASTRPSSKSSNQSGRESFQLFAPREIGEDVIKPAVIAPRAGMRPPSRNLHDIVGEDDDVPLPVAQTPKAGLSNAPRRTFFVGEDIDEAHSTPDRRYKSHPQKFSHFQMEDEPQDVETPKVLPPKRTSIYGKPGTSWDFADFTTPDKRPGKIYTQSARNFTWSDDDDTSPVRREPKGPAPRKDAETHFDIVDETPKKGDEPARKPYMRRDNETHFEFVDDSPAHGSKTQDQIPAARKAAVKMMDANWDNNSSPLGEPKPVTNTKGINVGGDGMGGRKGSDRTWTSFEDESPLPVNGKKGGITISGNGMGGRTGTDVAWAFDGGLDDEDEQPAAKKENVPIAGRSSYRGVRNQNQVTSDFWEF